MGRYAPTGWSVPSGITIPSLPGVPVKLAFPGIFALALIIASCSSAPISSLAAEAQFTAPPTPVVAPTPDRDVAAARYLKITDAMNAAVERAWRYGDGITTLRQMRAYHKAVYAALSRWDKNLRSGKYPADTMADYRILLQRLSTALVLTYGVPQDDTFYRAGKSHDKFLAAWDSLMAAEAIVGKDLGLVYE
jgi:hypothetical protein